MGSANARRLRGQSDVAGDGLMRGLAIVFGVLGMLFFGVIIGGLVAIVVVILASFSEKAAAYASPTDRGVAGSSCSSSRLSCGSSSSRCSA